MKKGRDVREGVGLAEIQEYLEVPLRRPLFVIVPMVLAVAGAIAAGFLLPERYRSSTLILVESEKVPEAFVGKTGSETMSRRLQTIQQEVLSRTRLERVLSELDPYRGPATSQPVSVQVERMRASIRIQTKGDDAFTIQYEHTDPKMAQRVADRLAAIFIGESERDRERQAVEGVEFIDSQLLQARESLEQKEEALRRFKEGRIGSLPEQLQTNLATLQRLQMERQTVEESLRAAQARVDLLRQSLQQESRTATVGADDPAAQLPQLRSQLAMLRTRYTDEHPDVLALRRRIEDLEKTQRTAAPVFDPDGTSPRAQLARAEPEVESLKTRRSRIEGDMARLQAQVDSAPHTEQQLATLTRDYTQIRENYEALLKKQMEAQMAEHLERRWRGARFRVLDPAHLPDEPFYPDRVLLGLLGLFGGLGLGLMAAFAGEYLDHSVKNTEDLETLLPQPILASLPFIREGAASRGSRGTGSVDAVH